MGAPIVVGASLGAVSRIEGDCGGGRDDADDADDEGRYVRGEDVGLVFPGGKLCFLKCNRAVARRLGVSSFLPTWEEEDRWEEVGLASS